MISLIKFLRKLLGVHSPTKEWLKAVKENEK